MWLWRSRRVRTLTLFLCTYALAIPFSLQLLSLSQPSLPVEEIERLVSLFTFPYLNNASQLPSSSYSPVTFSAQKEKKILGLNSDSVTKSLRADSGRFCTSLLFFVESMETAKKIPASSISSKAHSLLRGWTLLWVCRKDFYIYYLILF